MTHQTATSEAVDPLGPDALDFWLGTWDVSWGDGGHGTNTGSTWEVVWPISYRRA